MLRKHKANSGLTGKSTRSPTIFDVADLAGVSLRTVSRALADSGPVAADTRKRILAATQKLGYSPNLLARGLAKGKTQTIGLVVEMLSGHFLNHTAIEMIARSAWEAGYKLIISTHQGEVAKEDLCIQELLGHQVDGCIIYPCRTGPSKMLGQVVASGLPVVTVDSQCDLPVCNITVDREHGAYLQVQHLLDIGRRRLVFLILGVMKDWPIQHRFRGYRQACQDHGIDFEKQLVFLEPQSWETIFAGGAELAARALKCGTNFDGLVAYSDQAALGAMITFAQAGKRIPEEVAVIGFDDEPTAAYWKPALSSIHQPREVGQMAVKMLVNQIEAGDRFAEPSEECPKVVLKPHLVVRESTAGRASRKRPGLVGPIDLERKEVAMEQISKTRG